MKYKVGDIVKLSTGEKGTITKAWGRYSATIGDDNYDEYNFDEKEIIGLWEGRKPKLKLIDILNKIANGELKEGTKLVLGNNGGIEYKGIDDYFMFQGKDLTREVKLIEPEHFPDVGKMAEPIREDTKMIEPTECEHEWKRYSLGRLGQRTENHRYCSKCGADEIEPTDNTKIEELKGNGRNGNFYTIHDWIVTIEDKLNEVIRYINK